MYFKNHLTYLYTTCYQAISHRISFTFLLKTFTFHSHFLHSDAPILINYKLEISDHLRVVKPQSWINIRRYSIIIASKCCNQLNPSTNFVTHSPTGSFIKKQSSRWGENDLGKIEKRIENQKTEGKNYNTNVSEQIKETSDLIKWMSN